MLRTLPFQLVLAAVIAGCNGDPKDTSEAPPLATDDTAETDCDAHAPVVTEVEVGNGGEQQFEGELLPSILIAVSAEDDDGDLDVMSMKLWWDTEVDGYVDTERSQDANGVPIQMRDLPCGVASATYATYFAVLGAPFAYATQYEVAASVADSHGVESEDAAIGVGWSPDENGNDGG
jgi:hypothetical protein